MRILVVSAILALSPVLAHADCSWHQEQVVMTCADGLVYDEEAKDCVKPVG